MPVGAASALAPGAYLLGTALVLAVVIILGWGAWRLRSGMLPSWDGPPARLAEIVVALGALVFVAEILGTVGQFRRGPLLVGWIGAGVVMGEVGRRLAGRTATRVEPAMPSNRAGATATNTATDANTATITATNTATKSPRIEIVAALVATAVVTAQWVSHVAVSYDKGMTHGDTLWYHAPFAARFVQTGRLWSLDSSGLDDLATPLHTFLPLTGSLFHAIVMVPFDNDLLSPLVNLGWGALAVLSAWCIGRRWGVGALLVLATVLLLGVPTLAGTQPGQASNDVGTAALFFVAIALLLESELEPVPTGLAGIAAGLGLGIKLTALVPLGIVTIGVVFVALRARRWISAVAWCGGLVVFGGFWLIRNWIIHGNPLPWSDISLGPFTFSAVIESRPALITVLDDWSTWRAFIFPGFSKSLGSAWTVIVALALVGGAIGLLRRRRPLDLWLGASVLAGFVAIAYIPFGADLGGGAFVFMVRYLTPELLTGFTLLVVAVAGTTPLRRALLVVLVALVALNSTARHIEDVDAWPVEGLIPAVLAGGAVLAVGFLLLGPRRARFTAAFGSIAVLIAVVVIGGGWLLQRHYFDRRYVDAGLPEDAVDEYVRDLSDERIAVLGTEHFYPFFGNDLSNAVSRRVAPRTGSPVSQCRAWRDVLVEQGARYIVVGHDPFASGIPDERWIASDPSVVDVLHDGKFTLYRVDGKLDPSGCT